MRRLAATLLISASLSFTAWGPFPDPLTPVTPVVPPDQSAELAKVRKLSLKRLRGWRHEIHLRIRDHARYRHSLRALIFFGRIGNHWLDAAFACIHGGEGAWNSRTGNGYFGGLQMDASFQRTYGPDFLRWFGPASNWPASVQTAVAIRAYETRGFSPWPNTSRACGLR